MGLHGESILTRASIGSSPQSSVTGNLKSLGVVHGRKIGSAGPCMGRNGRGSTFCDEHRARGSPRRMVGEIGRWVEIGEGELGRVRHTDGEQGRLVPTNGELGLLHGDEGLARGCAREGERGRKEALTRRLTVSGTEDDGTCRGVSFGLRARGLRIDASRACSGSDHWTWRTFARRRCAVGRSLGSSAQHCCMSAQSASGRQ